MKTPLTLIALALASSVVAAQPMTDNKASSHGDRAIVRTLPTYVDGSEYELALAASVAAAQAATGNVASSRSERAIERALPGYVDGSEYEMALTKFMSQKTREQVRSETLAALRQGFDSYTHLSQMGGAH